ncbi:ABC transporter substrate-binding protein [Bombiscardovia nodaiensis]|uniref:ABC transporter substrate-binding protein n=1 Tax=Bombiscardovia nodaiensis TaxID=2932181 RepID=A0ABM8B8Z3_9BIFI|nr:ABC transporter substrate-binding protein [Bombiscardovia nodaiensis]
MSVKRASRKLLPAALAALVALTTLTACGVDNAYTKNTVSALPAATYQAKADQPAWKSDKRKDNKLLWYVNADWWNKSWGKDMVTKQVKKDLNLDIEFVTGDDSKLNTYFAGGDLPDVVTVLDANSRVVKSANNWAYPLEDLAKKYDPYFTKVASKQTLDWYRLKDGKVYGYPSYSNTSQDYKSGAIHASTGFIIRKDVLDAIGPQDFTTREGFMAGMKAIKEHFPDLVPFGFNEFNGGNGSMDDALQNMLGVPTESAGHQYYDRRLDREYLDWLNTFRQVHASGGISDDSFADDNDAFKEKLSTGKYASILIKSLVNQSVPIQTWASKNPDKQYVAVDGIRSSKGLKPTLTETGLSGWTVSFISKQCRNPSKAIQAFTYLLSDYGQMLVNFGIEGDTYETRSDGTVRWTAKANDIRLNNSKSWQNDYRIGEFVLFGHDKYKALNPDSFADAVKQIQAFGQPYLTTQYDTENVDPDVGTLQARANSAISTKWATTLVSLMRSGSQQDFDQVLKDYRDFLGSNRIDEINVIRNQKIQDNRKRLGL